MGLDSAIQHLLKAKRISAQSQSYAKDNPNEWAKVKAYLEGGARPSGVTTEMGLGLIEVEDARRGPAPPPDDYPASYYTGPSGQGNILPPKKGAFLGTAQGGSFASVEQQIADLESYIGRKIDIEHRFMQGQACTPLDVGLLNSIISRGHIPMVSWAPTPSNGGRILAGEADACLRSFGQQIAAQPHSFFLRMFWEANGDWYDWSKRADGSLMSATEHRDMFRRAVDKLREGGAFPKAKTVWCPHESNYGNPGNLWDITNAYPGDPYVDWVGSDDYNGGGWCGNHAGWCMFAELFTHGQCLGDQSFGVQCRSSNSPRGVEKDFRGRKPYMVGETGSTDGNGDKGAWMRKAGEYLKLYMPGAHAFCYFDVDVRDYGETNNYRIDTSESSKQGFRDLARDPYFNTRT